MSEAAQSIVNGVDTLLCSAGRMDAAFAGVVRQRNEAFKLLERLSASRSFAEIHYRDAVAELVTADFRSLIAKTEGK